MYKFKEYNQKNREVLEFKTKKEFLTFIDSFCENKGLAYPKENQALMLLGENFVDSDGLLINGISISGFTHEGSRIVGFFQYIDSDEN